MTFDEAICSSKVIALADNQILRLIRKETGREISLEVIEGWYKERDILRKHKNSYENRKRIKELQGLIYEFMYVPEYITIVMEANSHYRRLFDKGLKLNGKKYVRMSCSASQGRVSTVVFVEETVAGKVIARLDNARDLNKELVPSKYNAYLGTSGSATKVVSTPRVCIIPDCFDTRTVKVNWVIETEGNVSDDIIEEREIPIEFNLFDGNGLISPTKAQEWADELDLDYLPAQWCVRASFTKGMLSVFDFISFCREINNENYNVRTLYGDIVDLRNVDVILTESQFKLWDSFESYQIYEQNCVKNGLTWGVALQTPKKDKDVLELNYQFLQTLKLLDEDIPELCRTTVEYFEGVTSENILYTILFLLGKNLDSENIVQQLKSSDNYWINALMFCHDLINDTYIREKIYDTVSTRIKDACMGKILVEGNFQVIVPDSFAFMQHACGLKVEGLLKQGEFYSNYWNNKGVGLVDGMRSPLTHISEHNLLTIAKNDEMDKWFKYYYTGMIANCKDEHTLRFSGSDYDYDIIATTSNPIIIKGTYKNQLPIVYEVPKAEKIKITSHSLFHADLFSFGSIIGAITNKTTNMYALLPYFKEDSEEYQILMNRLKMGCKLQSAQIDKAKIGKKVKGIPLSWTQYNPILEGDSEETVAQKNIYNNVLCDKHPYFFIYLYRDTHKKYKNYYNGYDKLCKTKFGINITELQAMKRKNTEQREFLEMFKKYLPVVDSSCEMNRICHYIESINFNIKSKLKQTKNSQIFHYAQCKNVAKNDLNYKKVLDVIRTLKKDLSAKNDTIAMINRKEADADRKNLKNNLLRKVKNDLNEISSDRVEICNYLVEIFYKELPSYNKSIMYQLCGKQIVENIKNNCGRKIQVPVADENGDFVFLNQKYRVEEVEIVD